MTRFKKLFGLFLPVLMLMSLLSGNAQAALLDFGPIVPEVVGSTPPNIGHGFPAWFRDTNRVPVQLCLDEFGACLFTAEDLPNPLAPASFPTNLPDELFYYAVGAIVTNVNGGVAEFFSGVEMNFTDSGDGNPEQVGFSRVRIRFDSTVAGKYVVTTPFKQYFFTVTAADIAASVDGRRVVNFTEDIGLGHDGDFTGVIKGNIGPFVYSQGAPFVGATGAFLGTGAPLPLLGSTFIDPVTGQPANHFRVDRIVGTTLTTLYFADQFTVIGKLYTGDIATPLTVDKLTYARDAAGVQINTFATTNPLANPRNTTALFPLNFALTGVPSALQVSGTGLPTQGMTTNNPADGKFFTNTGVFALQNLPATATVTNTADSPVTPITVPLVDQVVINKADFNPLTQTLSITAVSYDSVDNPALQAFIAGTDVLLGTLVNGQLDVTFPVAIGQGQGLITYNIPPQNVTVKSAKLGSATAPVSVVIPAPAPIANNDTATTVTGAAVIINVIANDTPLSTINPASLAANAPTGGTAAANLDGTVTYTPPATPGVYSFTYTVKSNTTSPATSNIATVLVTVNTPAAITTPVNGSTLAAASQTFTWSNAGASSYQLWVGTAPGKSDIGVFRPGSAATITATGLPVNGRLIYVRLYSLFGTTWSSSDYTYTAAGTPVAAAMITPANASTLTGTSQAFTWGNVAANSYQLWVGTAAGTKDIGVFRPGKATTTTATGLPINGSTIHVRLYSLIGTTWVFNDYSYTSGP